MGHQLHQCKPYGILAGNHLLSKICLCLVSTYACGKLQALRIFPLVTGVVLAVWRRSGTAGDAGGQQGTGMMMFCPKSVIRSVLFLFACHGHFFYRKVLENVKIS